MSDDELAIYDEIEIEDMTFNPDLQLYTYPCPCGDRFQIGLGDLQDNEDIAVCPSCSLMIRVIFDMVRLGAPLRPARMQGCLWGTNNSKVERSVANFLTGGSTRPSRE